MIKTVKTRNGQWEIDSNESTVKLRQYRNNAGEDPVLALEIEMTLKIAGEVGIALFDASGEGAAPEQPKDTEPDDTPDPPAGTLGVPIGGSDIAVDSDIAPYGGDSVIAGDESEDNKKGTDD